MRKDAAADRSAFGLSRSARSGSMTFAFDLDLIARETGLGPEKDISWQNEEVPLNQRGISLTWLFDFLRAVDRERQRLVEGYEKQKHMNIISDQVPWPDPLPFPLDLEVNASFLVPAIIKPLTDAIKGPLFARVPLPHRGLPTLFVSHVWRNPLLSRAFSTLNALDSPYNAQKFQGYIWIDVASYNQHRVECIASDMKAVISSIGNVGIPMINSAPFGRLWCLWEILCAYLVKANVTIFEPTSSAYALGEVRGAFNREFKSVEQAATTLPEDREQILSAMVSTFGSIENTDRYVRELVNRWLAAETDKPWRRSSTD